MENNTQDSTTTPQVIKQPKSLYTPILIFIAIIVLLVVLIKLPVNSEDTSLSLPGAQNINEAEQKLAEAKNQAKIPDQKLSPADHTMGNLEARIVIFEYSDLDCPYCVKFHPTMKQLVKDYPNDVLWIYRHFPLDSLHPNARIESVASECAASLGGNNAFWQFVDSAFAFNSSGVADPKSALTGFATALNIDKVAFEKCLNSGQFDKSIDAQQNLAIQSGAQGTPYNVILDRKTGALYPAPGAQDLETMREIVKTILAE